LLRTNTLRPRRTTTDPAFCFNALSEFLAFICAVPSACPACSCRLLKGQPFSYGQNSGLADPCNQSRRGALERHSGLPPGGMEPLKHCACYR
jgi:hypothetical protein